MRPQVQDHASRQWHRYPPTASLPAPAPRAQREQSAAGVRARPAPAPHRHTSGARRSAMQPRWTESHARLPQRPRQFHRRKTQCLECARSWFSFCATVAQSCKHFEAEVNTVNQNARTLSLWARVPPVFTNRCFSPCATASTVFSLSRGIDNSITTRLLCEGNAAKPPVELALNRMTTNDSQSSPNSVPVRKVRKAVLPAAGLGTRFLPATKAQPKEMLTVVDKPQIQYVVEECVASGIEHIIIVTGKGKNSIEDHFDSAPALEHFLEERGKKDQAEMVRRISDMVQVSYTRQKEPLGLGHAVLVAKDLVGDEPFAVLLGDVLIPGENPATKQLI